MLSMHNNDKKYVKNRHIRKKKISGLKQKDIKALYKFCKFFCTYLRGIFIYYKINKFIINLENLF